MELLVVVTGVLLALMAQEWAQGRDQRARMRAALEAVRIEARDNLFLMLSKQSLNRCLIDREILIRDRLRASNGPWQPIVEPALTTRTFGPLNDVPIFGVMQRQSDPFTTAAFRSALATGALSGLGRKQFDALNGLYSMYDALNAEEAKGDQSIRQLAALGQPITITPEIKAEMFGALYSADRSRFQIQYAWWNNLLDFYRTLGWDNAAEIDRLIAEDHAAEVKMGVPWRPCHDPLRNPFRQPIAL